MRRAAVCLSLFFLLVPTILPAAPPALGPGEELTLERCIEIGIANQPEILQYLYTLEASQADLGKAKASYYPRLDVKGTLTGYNLARKTDDPYPPINLYGYRYLDNTLSLSQKIYDFGRREAEVDVARHRVDAARLEMEDRINNLVNRIKGAYYEVLKAQISRDIDREAREQYRKQLDQARLFFAAGKRPKYDVTNAEVYLSGAEMRLIDSENALRIARLTLNTAMGYEGDAPYTLKGVSLPEKGSLSEGDALDGAYKNRRDLRALLAQREAAVRATDQARREYFPSLDANGAYEFAGSQTPLAQGWTVGVGLTWNLFQGFATREGLRKAQADLKTQEAKIAALRLQILQEVKTALLSIKRAEESMANARLQVRQATENLEQVNLRYEAGLATSLEVTTATVNLSQARQAEANAFYNYLSSQANLQKAMGVR
ncbi:MAG TPA: TolC family protein [Syntrophales bacterium]|nr:TolC family protein [Syntrophales bacterium]HOM06523.1 TolC family protein [Syntrophales bacterium]HON99908.1 TolC family protein [Syntrophales bacterium]HPC00635.1 TolC family protein [Syntrophales bacterium]HPQ06215.1 TolC family protein [Syntrophales bacterium]